MRDSEEHDTARVPFRNKAIPADWVAVAAALSGVSLVTIPKKLEAATKFALAITKKTTSDQYIQKQFNLLN